VVLNAGWESGALAVSLSPSIMLDDEASVLAARTAAAVVVGSFYAWFLSAPIGVPKDLTAFVNAWGVAYPNLASDTYVVTLEKAKQVTEKCAGGVLSEVARIAEIMKELGAEGPVGVPAISIARDVGISYQGNSMAPESVWRSEPVGDISIVTGLTECDVATAVVLSFLDLGEAKRYYARVTAWLNDQARLVKFRVLNAGARVSRIVTGDDIERAIIARGERA
jgi:hypothetical protein